MGKSFYATSIEVNASRSDANLCGKCHAAEVMASGAGKCALGKSGDRADVRGMRMCLRKEKVMKYQIIAIEREYASGGNEVGERVAMHMDIPCYGQEVLNRAAERMHTVPEHLLHLEETTSNSLMYSLGMAAKVVTGERNGLSDEGLLYVTEEQVIKDMALQGPCVIVGRCAGWILRDRTDVLRVFIHAAPEFRRKRAVEEYGIAEKYADSTLKRFDRRRSNFYRANTGMSWDDKKGYHLVLDSSALGIKGCVDAICTLARV